MPLLLLPSGAVVPVFLVEAPVGADPEEHAARCLALTLTSFPEGTRALPVEAPPPELAGLPPECWTWDEEHQRLTAAKDLGPAWGRIRQRRDEALAASEWRVTRAREQSERSRPGASKELQALLDYRQALRDLPAAGGDPRAVTWPTPPWKE